MVVRAWGPHPVWGSLYTPLTLSSYVFIFNRENKCKERNGFSRLRAPGSGTKVEEVRGRDLMPQAVQEGSWKLQPPF